MSSHKERFGSHVEKIKEIQRTALSQSAPDLLQASSKPAANSTGGVGSSVTNSKPNNSKFSQNTAEEDADAVLDALGVNEMLRLHAAENENMRLTGFLHDLTRQITSSKNIAKELEMLLRENHDLQVRVDKLSAWMDEHQAILNNAVLLEMRLEYDQMKWRLGRLQKRSDDDLKNPGRLSENFSANDPYNFHQHSETPAKTPSNPRSVRTCQANSNSNARTRR